MVYFNILVWLIWLIHTVQSGYNPGHDRCVMHLNKPEDSFVVVPAMYKTVYPSKPWYTKFNVCEYQRKNSTVRGYVPNFAWEAGIYLRYIIDHYDNLPNTIVFLQEDTTDNVGNRLACLKPGFGFQPVFFGYFPDRYIPSHIATPYMGPLPHFQNVIPCWKSILRDFDMPKIYDVGYQVKVANYCCAYFAAERDQIRRHPLSAYVNAYIRTMEADSCVWDDPVASKIQGDKFASSKIWATVWEHLWHVIIGGHPYETPRLLRHAKEWCNNWVPNGDICTSSPCE